MRKTTFKPTVESLDERLTPSTFTEENNSFNPVYVALIRHNPAQSGMLSDGTDFGPYIPGSWEDIGYYKVAPRSSRQFYVGDEDFFVRINDFHGVPERIAGQSSTSEAIVFGHSFDVVKTDGYANFNVTVDGRYRGSYPDLHRAPFVWTGGFYHLPNGDWTLRLGNKVLNPIWF